MCASCGCGKANDNHGEVRHITLADLAEAASAADISVDEVVRNLQETTQDEDATSAAG